MSGNTLIVGASQKNSNLGAAYVCVTKEIGGDAGDAAVDTMPATDAAADSGPR